MTDLAWEDLVLPSGTRDQIDEIRQQIRQRIRYAETLTSDWAIATSLSPGYRSLFHGPPGTGKTMTACLLGKSIGLDVYKVDLSSVISKFVGETEKNLAKVFEQARDRRWLLFFDEADALFGKRTATKAAHDRHAATTISFVLQQFETSAGITILATNSTENIDHAFVRRFESTVHFPMPRPEERLRLWRQGFSTDAALDDSLDLERVAVDHPLSGGAIMNAIRHATMRALTDGDRAITLDDVMRGIRREDKNR